MQTIFAIIGLIILFYIIYINGYMVINAKRAVTFIGSLGRMENRCKAVIVSCNGWMKRVIRFRQLREYHFKLDYRITEGAFHIEIQNKNKEVILLLDEMNKEGSIKVDKKERYYLVLKFENASGEYELSWE